MLGAFVSPTGMRVLRGIGIAITWLILVLLTVWAVAALYVDVRIPSLRILVALIYCVVVITVLI